MNRRTMMTLASVAAAAATLIGGAVSSGQMPTMSSLTGNTTVVVDAGDTTISGLLPQIEVVGSLDRRSGYERGCGTDKKTGLRELCVFGPAWNNPDNRTGCDTRNIVLAAQLTDVVFKPGTRNCKVTDGWRFDPYSGQRINLKQTAIDHIVPLSAAWDAGAWQWTQRERVAFANDPDNLLAVSSRENSSKSDSTISEWLPDIDRCEYVQRYLSVIAKYQLPITEADRRIALTTCPAAVT